MRNRVKRKGARWTETTYLYQSTKFNKYQTSFILHPILPRTVSSVGRGRAKQKEATWRNRTEKAIVTNEMLGKRQKSFIWNAILSRMVSYVMRKIWNHKGAKLTNGSKTIYNYQWHEKPKEFHPESHFAPHRFQHSRARKELQYTSEHFSFSFHRLRYSILSRATILYRLYPTAKTLASTNEN